MKLSVITINRNNKAGLKRTINSVISQTFNDYEYIIIDGASTDGSVDIIKEYSDKISYWISEPDRGIYNAMNKGIKVAKGDYCLFLNSADTLYNKDVLKQVFCTEPKEDIIYGDLIMGDTVAHAEKQITLKNLLFHTIGHQSSFIKRALLVDNPYDETLKIAADWKFFFQELILNNVSRKYLDLIISRFDMQGISMSHQQELKEEHEKVLKELIPPTILDEIYKYFGINDKYFELFVNIGNSPYKWKIYNFIVFIFKIITLNRKPWIKKLKFFRK